MTQTFRSCQYRSGMECPPALQSSATFRGRRLLCLSRKTRFGFKWKFGISISASTLCFPFFFRSGQGSADTQSMMHVLNDTWHLFPTLFSSIDHFQRQVEKTRKWAGDIDVASPAWAFVPGTFLLIFAFASPGLPVRRPPKPPLSNEQSVFEFVSIKQISQISLSFWQPKHPGHTATALHV